MLVNKTKSIIDEIICDDARNLGKYVQENSISLTITSPPYRNAIDYSQHVSNMKKDDNVWMRGSGTQSTESYLNLMKEIFDQVFLATKEGGFCCVIIGDEVVNGKLIPLPSLLLSKITSIENDDDPTKWRFRDMIIWNKVTSGRNGAGNRFGIFIQRPYPTYFRANIMHEYILVLQKSNLVNKKIHESSEPVPLNRLVKREFANSIWNIAPVPPRSINHPAPFPEQIPWRLVTLYSKEGDVIMDPMNGSGQTTKVAHQMNRKYIGFDIRKEYVHIAKSRLKQKLSLGNMLIPVYHIEDWSTDEQIGYFETKELDLSKNIPAGYKFLMKTESDRMTHGKKGIYAYYENALHSYLCFIIGANGKLSRLNLGALKESGSMLNNVLINLPNTSFIKADLNNVLETRIVENRQPVKACIDILQHLELVKTAKLIGSSQYFAVTEKGKKIAESLKNNRKNNPTPKS